MGKVISLLEAAMTYCIDHFQFEADNFEEIIEAISPNPSTTPCLIRNQAATFFFLLSPKLKEYDEYVIILKAFDSTLDCERIFEIKINLNKLVDTGFAQLIWKLAISDIVKRIEDTPTS